MMTTTMTTKTAVVGWRKDGENSGIGDDDVDDDNLGSKAAQSRCIGSNGVDCVEKCLNPTPKC